MQLFEKECVVMKRFFCILAAMCLVLSLAVPASASSSNLSDVEQSVENARDRQNTSSIGTLYIKENSSGKANVRIKPDKLSTCIFRVPCGTEYDVIGQDYKTEWYVILLPNGSKGYISNQLGSFSFGTFSTTSCSFVIGSAKANRRVCGYSSPNAQSQETAMEWLSKGSTYSIVGECDGYYLLMCKESGGIMYVDGSNLTVKLNK